MRIHLIILILTMLANPYTDLYKNIFQYNPNHLSKEKTELVVKQVGLLYNTLGGAIQDLVMTTSSLIN